MILCKQTSYIGSNTREDYFVHYQTCMRGSHAHVHCYLTIQTAFCYLVKCFFFFFCWLSRDHYSVRVPREFIELLAVHIKLTNLKKDNKQCPRHENISLGNKFFDTVGSIPFCFNYVTELKKKYSVNCLAKSWYIIRYNNSGVQYRENELFKMSYSICSNKSYNYQTCCVHV